MIGLCFLASTALAKYRRLYPEAPLPRDQVAFVSQFGGTNIGTINGVALHEGFWTLTGIEGGELLPGQYEFCVSYEMERREERVSAACVTSRVTLAPGHIYVFTPQVSSGAFRPAFNDVAAIQGPPSAGLRRVIGEIDKYFRGKRREFKHAAKLAEATARLKNDVTQLSQTWDRVGVGAVVEVALDDTTLVAVVDKLKEDALIYYAIDDPDNTYSLRRTHIRTLRILAASVEEYRNSQAR